MVEEPNGTRLAARLEHDRSPGPVGMRRFGAVYEQWLVHPGAGVHDPRPSRRAAPSRRIVAGKRPTAMDMTEQDPFGIDAEAMYDPGEGGDARASHLGPQQRGRQGRDACRPAGVRRPRASSTRAGTPPGRRSAPPTGVAASGSAAPPTASATVRRRARSRSGSRRRGAGARAGRGLSRTRIRAAGGGRGSGHASPRFRARARRPDSGRSREPEPAMTPAGPAGSSPRWALLRRRRAAPAGRPPTRRSGRRRGCRER